MRPGRLSERAVELPTPAGQQRVLSTKGRDTFATARGPALPVVKERRCRRAKSTTANLYAHARSTSKRSAAPDLSADLSDPRDDAWMTCAGTGHHPNGRNIAPWNGRGASVSSMSLTDSSRGHTSRPRPVIQWKGHPPATDADTQTGPGTATAEASRTHQRAATGRRRPSIDHA